jgi:hypothetical protein
MESIQAILGVVMLTIIAVAVILGFTIIVLIEARWTLRLWVELYRRWKSIVRQLRDDGDADQDQTAEWRHGS